MACANDHFALSNIDERRSSSEHFVKVRKLDNFSILRSSSGDSFFRLAAAAAETSPFSIAKSIENLKLGRFVDDLDKFEIDFEQSRGFNPTTCT